MALGSVNVPGVSAKDLKDVRTIAENAKSAAETATTTANAAKTAAEEANTKAAKAASDVANLNKQIEEGGGISGGSGGNTIKITFEAEFVGQTYTVTDGDDTKTGTVPESKVVSVKAVNCNSTFPVL